MSERDAALEEAAKIADDMALAAINVGCAVAGVPGSAAEADSMARGVRMVAASIRARRSGGASGRFWLEVAGHGSGYVRLEVPLAVDTAVRSAENWERTADTIGGRARVVDDAGNAVWSGR